tara:strand:- start:373 stop:624 length:252 start_codon:yes stop_codon:yes gene_type:complete
MRSDYRTNNTSAGNKPTTAVISAAITGKNCPEVIPVNVNVSTLPRNLTVTLAGSAAVPMYIAEGELGDAGKAAITSNSVPKSG